MALTDKLTAIGDAIREKTGKSAPLTLDEMPGNIRGISGEGGGGGPEPATGFVPTEWDDSGLVLKGKWLGGGTIPAAFFTGFSASAGQYIRMTQIDGLEQVSSVSNYAFRYCNGLTAMAFSEALTSLGTNSFQGCSILETVDIGGTPSLSNGIFNSCSALTTLILRGDRLVSLPNTNVFIGTPIAAGTGYIYVPAALVNTYKSAANWANYAGQIRAIEG